MPKRKLHIVNPLNPVFAVCERCNARFTSFAANAEEAETAVQTAFDQHECGQGKDGDQSGVRAPASGQ